MVKSINHVDSNIRNVLKKKQTKKQTNVPHLFFLFKKKIYCYADLEIRCKSSSVASSVRYVLFKNVYDKSAFYLENGNKVVSTRKYLIVCLV